MLDIRGISVSYRMLRTGETLQALDSLSFQVEKGRFAVVVGPSGCGKTTLLHVVAGLQQPDSGSVTLEGESLMRPGPSRAMVFQAPSLLPWRTVLRNVTYGLELQGVDLQVAVERAQDHLKLVGLAGFEDSYPHELSQGMQQRVNLARALTMEPQLLLLDEPFAALDAQTRLRMQLELQAIWEEVGSTALFVTHQITEAILLADQVITLTGRPGRLKAIVPVDLPRPRTRELKRTPNFIELEEEIWDLIGDEALAPETNPLPEAEPSG